MVYAHAPPRCGPGFGACPVGQCCNKDTRTCAVDDIDDDRMASELCSSDPVWADKYNGAPTWRCERELSTSTGSCSGDRGRSQSSVETMRCGPAFNRLCPPLRRGAPDLCCVKQGARDGLCLECGSLVPGRDVRWAWDEATRKWITVTG
jgi:hypothetical protein